MAASITSKYRLKYGGFAVAAVGFVLTRFAALETARPHPSPSGFLIAVAPPLVVGLVIILVGIGLALSNRTREAVNTIAKWCLLGTAGMLIAVSVSVGQTMVYSGVAAAAELARSGLVTNALLGGAVGGLLIGVRSATNRRHRRDLRRQIDRNRVLNRILRHEVLNKLNVISGRAELLAGDAAPDGGVGNDVGTIIESARRIEAAIERIGYLVGTAESADRPPETVDLRRVLEGEIDAIEREYPAATVTVEGLPPELSVRADDHLSTLFGELLRNATEYDPADAPSVTVAVEPRPGAVRVRIADDGPGLPPERAAILTEGRISEYDDPSSGFGLTLVRFLVERYDGAVDVETGDDGTTIAVTLPRPGHGGIVPENGRYGLGAAQLQWAAAAALLAGVIMGGLLQLLTDALPAIGGLYGANSLAAGWVLHLFHSVVFGFLFAAAVARPPLSEHVSSIPQHVLAGIGYGIVLWLVAAGVIMPLWLNLVGIPAPIPLLPLGSLVGHAVWGALLGGLYGLRG